ncbi:MAG: hypothetical protein JST11_30960 [Acidobacteria bacterium]|nr:hypothetical protein [Acidobacteriota bacterium]
MTRRLLVKLVLWGAAAYLAVGLILPYFSVERYARRLQSSLERSLGRRVELQGVHFSLFSGPGFSIQKVVIHEDPAIGIEPVAYIDEPGSMVIEPSIWSLLGGKFVIASISLDQASINLTKTGPAQEWGRWNFASLINPSVMRSAPAIHVRNGRIHFKFGDTKSVFYLTETDLDASPTAGGDWKISLEGRPARTDRPAQGLGSFRLKGRWYADYGRADMDLVVERTQLGEVTALLNGQDAGVHGALTARIHLAGPLNNLGITGRVDVSDIHRWDMMPTNQQGWPLNVSGLLDLIGQRLELHSASAGNAPMPLSVHFRATDYLAQPHWAVSLNWNKFPVAPILELARHMGAQLPPKLALSGYMDGALGYSGRGSLQGGLRFYDTVLTVPDSPPVRFDQANVIFDHGHARLFPALVRGEHDQARLEADWSLDDAALNLEISTDAMQVASLRAQVALANVPGLEQVTAGEWAGDIRFHRDAGSSGWQGKIALRNVEIPMEGFAEPFHVTSAQMQIDGARLSVDRIEARAGKLAFTGDYRYDPALTHPHRVRLRGDTWDAAVLEALFMPTLRRNTNLIARALGRPMVTDWLRQRRIDATVQLGALLLAGARLEKLHTRVLWDVGRVQFENLQAAIGPTTFSGNVDVNLRGSRPTYHITAKVKGLPWQSGRLDADTTLETFGTGLQLLGNITGDGSFSAAGVDWGSYGVARNVSGDYTLAWSQAGPRLRLSNLSVRTDDETFTGRAGTLDGGRLAALLNSGAREMRITGTLAKVKVE